MAIFQIFDLDGATTAFPVNTFGAVEKSQLSLKLVDEDDNESYVDASEWSVTGYGQDSESITVTWDNAVNYTAPATLKIIKSVRTEMLATFGSGPTTDKKLQDEFANIITNMIIPMLGVSNSTADLIFGSGNWTDDENGNWDGTDTISIGGDTNIVDILTTHESRLDTAESDIDALDVRLTAAEGDIDALETTTATHTAQLGNTASSALKTAMLEAIASLQDQIGSTLGLPAAVASAQAEAADSASPIQVLAVDTLGALEYIDLLAQVKNAPITDTGNYFTTDTVNAAFQQLGASLTGGVVWQAGGYFLLERQGGLDPAAAATQYNDPAANTTPIRTGNMDGGTSAHATNWIVMSDTNVNQRMVVFLPTDATGAGYSADDYELSMLECTDTGTGAVRLGTTNIGAYTIEAKSDGSAFYINGVSNAGGPAAAITIKRVRTI